LGISLYKVLSLSFPGDVDIASKKVASHGLAKAYIIYVILFIRFA
jgi:hypothetical protein